MAASVWMGMRMGLLRSSALGAGRSLLAEAPAVLPTAVAALALGIRTMSVKVPLKKLTASDYDSGKLVVIEYSKPEKFKETFTPDLSGKDILRFIEGEQIKRMGMQDREWFLSKKNPARLTPGSVVKVHRVMDGANERPIIYVGTVIAIRRRGISTTFSIINKIEGELLQFNFPVFSPLITRIELLRQGQERRQKLYRLANPQDCPVIPETATFKQLNPKPKALTGGKDN